MSYTGWRRRLSTASRYIIIALLLLLVAETYVLDLCSSDWGDVTLSDPVGGGYVNIQYDTNGSFKHVVLIINGNTYETYTTGCYVYITDEHVIVGQQVYNHDVNTSRAQVVILGGSPDINATNTTAPGGNYTNTSDGASAGIPISVSFDLPFADEIAKLKELGSELVAFVSSFIDFMKNIIVQADSILDTIIKYMVRGFELFNEYIVEPGYLEIGLALWFITELGTYLASIPQQGVKAISDWVGLWVSRIERVYYFLRSLVDLFLKLIDLVIPT